MKIRFNRHELAGSLGDFGTLLPLAIGLIQINGLDPTAVILAAGVYYILSGLYFRMTMPVQPMKVVSAYAIASAMTPLQISSAGLWLGVILILLSVTSAMDLISRIIPKPVIRGVQLTTGVVLLTKGITFITGTSPFQTEREMGEPFLSIQNIGPVPVGMIIGSIAFIAIFALLKNKTFPAALVAIIGGALIGLALGGYMGLMDVEVGLNLPRILPYDLPGMSDLVIGLTILALPQTPMTIGNAILAQDDLAHEYFGEEAKRSTPRALGLSMGIANVLVALIGAMPMCHGSGGLAAHYRFGARTAGSNLIIGLIFVVAAILLGEHVTAVFGLLPFSVLGALLAFAGIQLSLVILDMKERKDLFVVIVLLGISLATNLAIGFVVGIILAYLLRSKLKLDV